MPDTPRSAIPPLKWILLVAASLLAFAGGLREPPASHIQICAAVLFVGHAVLFALQEIRELLAGNQGGTHD